MNNTPSSFYIHVPVDIPHELMKHVIGKNGKWFHYTIRQAEVSGIWFNKQRSIVEIWGPVNNLVRAAYAIRTRITYVKERFKSCVTEDGECLESQGDETTTTIRREWPNDEYAEMPLSTDEYHLGPAFTKHLIGKEGRHFKKLTRNTGVSFLWYSPNKHCVQIWGPKDSMSNAFVQLKQHISNLIYHLNNPNTTTDTDTDTDTTATATATTHTDAHVFVEPDEEIQEVIIE